MPKSSFALTQRSARIAVARGENAGATLDHTAIARDVVLAGPATTGGTAANASLTAPADVALGELRIVAFVQERASRRLLGATTRALVAQ